MPFRTVPNTNMGEYQRLINDQHDQVTATISAGKQQQQQHQQLLDPRSVWE